MDKLDVSPQFRADLEEIAEMVTDLDISVETSTFEDNIRQIQAKLDELVQTKKNLVKLEKAYLTGTI